MRARADARAPRCAGGERALLVAAKEGREDLVELLLGFKAEVDARDAVATARAAQTFLDLFQGSDFIEGRDAFLKQGNTPKAINTLAVGRWVASVGYSVSF